MNGLSRELLSQIIRLSPDGIVVCERSGEDWAVLFANEAFEQLTGYSLQELKGRDLRMLQGEEREQENRQRVRLALAKQEACRALLRNFRKDGTPFWNEMLLVPAKDAAGNITQYIGFHHDASERLRAAQARPGGGRDSLMATGTYPSLFSVLRDDRLTGLYNRNYFEDLLRRDWAIAQRDKRQITLFVFDIDCLGAYNDTFGRQAGDSCIKRVGRAILGCLRRGSDLTARLEGGTIAALIQGMSAEEALKHANGILERVREQHIHHPRSQVQKYVTVSAGFVSLVPGAEQKSESLMEKAQQALKEAKATGRNRLVSAS